MEEFFKEIIVNAYPFNELTQKQKEALVKLCQIREYNPGEFIYRQNSSTDSIYILIKGRLVALSEYNDKESEIELIKRGTVFGIISFFTNENHSVSIKSIERSEVAEISKREFRNFLIKNPKLTIALSQIFSQRIRRRLDRPKKIFQSVKVAITSFSNNIGKTTYLLSLTKNISAASSNKKTIAIEFSYSDNFSLFSEKSSTKILNINEFEEESLERYINKDSFDWLCVRLDSRNTESIFSLINYLSESYNFVLFELPEVTKESLVDLLPYTDFVHLLSSLDKNELIIINSLTDAIGVEDINKLKIISCDFLGLRQSDQVKFKIYATIPDLNRTDYNKAIRRISRELSDKTVGLVLGSGVAFGLAHIGVLEVFEENNIPVDIITGSSIGSLIATLWALGYSSNEIKNIASIVGKKLGRAFFSGFSLPIPFRGFFKAKKLESILKELFDEKTFHDLKHGLRIVAFDFIRREAKIIKDGLLYKAVAASCSMPGVFEPVIFKDEIYLDGGILNPLPVKAVIDYARKIIAINVTPSQEEIIKLYKQKRSVFNILDFIFGSVETMQREFIADAQKISDITIHPEMGDLSWVDFSKLDEFIKIGRVAALNRLEEIKKVINS